MTEFDRIPKEVFSEAEKFGVLEKDILFAAHADKDRNGVFCDNWVLITEEEIVMIGGIQPFSDIRNECEYLTSIGVFPTIMPFRPLDDCTFFDVTSCNPDELIEASEFLGALLRKEGLAPECQEGCTKCGGCSIENDCYLKGQN